MTDIGTLREQPLHAALKEHYRRPGDAVEVSLDGFVVDLVRGRELVEIQTGSFASMRRKLDRLLDGHALRIVHPIAQTTWILKQEDSGEIVSRRRSPRRGQPTDVCSELVSFPTLLSHPNFRLDVVLVEAEEIRSRDDRAWRRKGWSVTERRLVRVVECLELSQPHDLLGLLPQELPDTFDTADLAASLRRPRRAAQAVAYCLREAGVLEATSRGRSGIRYRLCRPAL